MLSLDKEKSLFSQGYKLIGSIDESGRGPLAGPVVAVTVTLKPKTYEEILSCEELKQINDSKKLTSKKREEFFDIIKEKFFEVGVGICDNKTVDRVNILQAAFLAMKKSIGALREKPDFILLDGGFPIPNITSPQQNIIKGDSFIFSIAAASIIAKVTRDQIMRQIHEKYPLYGFDKHKGYGTKFHLAALEKHGPCPLHRQSFKPISILIK